MKKGRMPNHYFKKNISSASNHHAGNELHGVSESECSEFFDMIREHATNLRLFDQINTDADWRLVSARVADKLPVNYRRISWHTYFLRIAALVVFTSGLSFGLYKLLVNTNSRENSGFVSENADQLIKEVILPDGSSVTLNKGSRLSYRGSFGVGSRDVILEGEALFNVVPGMAVPFQVFAGGSVVKVTGTSFSVSEARDGSVKVSVLSGTVELSSTREEQNKISIAANQSGYVLKNKQLKVEAGVSANVLSWKTGYLLFNQTPLDSALIDIAHHFGRSLELESTLKDEITAEFQNQPLREILNELKLVAGLQFDTTGTALIVRK
ncbi:MAG: FecR domain-containing protein [Bacteroidales bacterium]|nr:FecR domain-containing protein [Bacteroidales bacterium]